MQTTPHTAFDEVKQLKILCTHIIMLVERLHDIRPPSRALCIAASCGRASERGRRNAQIARPSCPRGLLRQRLWQWLRLSEKGKKGQAPGSQVCASTATAPGQGGLDL